jgi:hypothetical protein
VFDRLITDLVCTLCGQPSCDCWERCTCGWTTERGTPCRNPNTTKCSTKQLYGPSWKSSDGAIACEHCRAVIPARKRYYAPNGWYKAGPGYCKACAGVLFGLKTNQVRFDVVIDQPVYTPHLA